MPDKKTKLKIHLRTLEQYQSELQRLGTLPADETLFFALKKAVGRLMWEWPGRISPFPTEKFQVPGQNSFNSGVLRASLAEIIARLSIELEEATNSTEAAPAASTRDFSYVQNIELRAIVKRDYEEIQRAYAAHCWKAVIILCGGSIEAVLSDLLMHVSSATVFPVATATSPDLTRWDLNDLIKGAVSLKLVSSGLEKLSHSVREYRNLVHPGRELREKLTPGAEEARIALEVFNMLDRDMQAVVSEPARKFAKPECEIAGPQDRNPRRLN